MILKKEKRDLQSTCNVNLKNHCGFQFFPTQLSALFSLKTRINSTKTLLKKNLRLKMLKVTKPNNKKKEFLMNDAK